VVAATAAAGGLALGIGALIRWDEARRSTPDEYLSSDLVGLVVFAGVGLLVVGLLDVWAVRGGERRVRRLTVGLAVAALLTLPLLWWNAVPVMAATSVLVLSAGLPGEAAPRAARLSAVLVLAVVVALWIGSTLAAHL
jgi:hypothetical protein